MTPGVRSLNQLKTNTQSGSNPFQASSHPLQIWRNPTESAEMTQMKLTWTLKNNNNVKKLFL